MKSILYILRELHFTESEAKVYVALLENGPCTGYEISKYSGVARSKIYNVLELLQQRGAVSSAVTDKCKLYCAEPVSQLTNVIRSQMERNLTELEQEANTLSYGAANDHIWRIYDETAVKEKCIRMIQDAKQHFIMHIWCDDLDSKLEDAIVAKQKEMKNVAVILFDSKEEYNTRIERCYRHGFEQDKLYEMGERWLMAEADDQQMLYAAFSGADVGDAFYTSNRYMALFAREYIYHDIYCLRLIDHLREQVKSEFGFDMEGIRDIFSF